MSLPLAPGRPITQPGQGLPTCEGSYILGYSPFGPQFFCNPIADNPTNNVDLNNASRVKRKGRPVKRMNAENNTANPDFNIVGTTGDSISHSQEFQKRVCTFNPYNTYTGSQQIAARKPETAMEQQGNSNADMQQQTPQNDIFKKTEPPVVTGYAPENMWEFRSLVDRALENQQSQASSTSSPERAYSYRFFEEYAKHYATYLENKKTQANSTQTSSNQVFRCEYACCNKKFKNPDDLHAHVQTHLAVLKPHECKKCGKSYNNPEILTKHMKTHEKREVFACDKCQQKFQDVNRLIKHKKEHSRRKVFSCQHCGKILSKAITLLMHQRIHTGERPYSCNFCGKKFSYYNNLLVHERVHSGEKPYSCVECGKCFTQASTLTIHLRGHSGERPYPCDQCEKAFVSGNSLNIHKRSHSGIKPYGCEECGKTYSQASSLATHRKSHIK